MKYVNAFAIFNIQHHRDAYRNTYICTGINLCDNIFMFSLKQSINYAESALGVKILSTFLPSACHSHFMVFFPNKTISVSAIIMLAIAI